MKAAGVRQFGGADLLEVLDLPVPRPGGGEVLIRVHAAAVNPADTVSREGFHGRLDSTHLPHVPGIEGVGTVEELGPGTGGRLRVGDRVVFLALPPGRGPGSYAEHVAVPAASIVPAPESLPDAAAATLLMNALTARMALDRLDLQPGQSVAVTGAAGVLGAYTVQLAKNAGLHVIGDAAPADVDLVRSLGADEVVARGDGVAQRIRELRPDGVPGLADCSAQHGALLAAVADRGRFASVRSWKPVTERGIEIGTVLVNDRAHDTPTLIELVNLAAKGVLTPRVAEVLPARLAGTAHRRLAAGGIRGRLVLDVRDGF